MEFIFCVIMLGFLCYFIYNNFIWPVKEKKEKEEQERLAEETSAFMKYGVDGKSTLSVYKRGPEITKLVKIVDDKDIIMDYEPEKTHFGAVTVGNVTTGGTYTTGGDYYDRGLQNN